MGRLECVADLSGIPLGLRRAPFVLTKCPRQIVTTGQATPVRPFRQWSERAGRDDRFPFVRGNNREKVALSDHEGGRELILIYRGRCDERRAHCGRPYHPGM